MIVKLQSPDDELIFNANRSGILEDNLRSKKCGEHGEKAGYSETYTPTILEAVSLNVCCEQFACELINECRKIKQFHLSKSTNSNE